MSSQDTRRPAAKGKKKASTPTSSKEGAPALSPANASTPPGFAAKSTVSPKNKDVAQHSRVLRHRSLFIFRYYVGRTVEVTLKDKSKYAGVLHCIDPDDFTVVLKNTQRLTVDKEPFETGSTFVVQQYLLAHLSTKGLPDYENETQDGKPAAPTQTFQTDTDISNNSHAHLYGRELQTASSWLDPSLDSGELEARGGKTAWNQFEVNEKLFGVGNTYDENIYTTKLDKTKISAAQSKAAEKLAREIEAQQSQNFHVQEERGNYTQDSIDEEARYSSVVRPPNSIEKNAAMPRGANAYVPPALRKAEEAKAAAANKAISPKAAPVSPKVKKPASPKKEKTDAAPVAAPTPTTAAPASTTEANKQDTTVAPAPKKGLNPKAKEFKFNPSASSFVPQFTPAAAAPVVPQQHAYPGPPPQGQYVDEWAMNGGYDRNMDDPEMLMHQQHGGMQYVNQYGAPMMMQGPPMHHPMGHQMYPPMMDPNMGMPPPAYGGYPPAPYNPYQQMPPNAYMHEGRKEGNHYVQAPPPPLPR
ncbi:Aste57867_22024 [Aphanomyces stellatus]|uniref:Aste57867_22024 protein n=1 Tax=Aphanomyces stellatus TaxID=120398 RepID=A0A485LL60_9STRA|nr:hypothetical protein As57867_021955 [Aphanomyces stellatus]VFT98692.1 Aste57867_22024 [Aphanomyces stellatus]